jgi:hypothetical protein
MGRAAAAVLGVVLLALGVVFTLQGVNALHGSPMSGSGFWVAAGPVIGLVGVVLLVAAARHRR